ncbi:translation initiation factor IF-3 [Candidatus Curtissbacteria bacterium RBG_13_35_7]|uniref:Translation initiation factor IF-3 n=1 Tax=Candidatus Curtissbacteria bacterium RBG_13_35_7 TaxID=1797705 RepID=A0A1F5G400_9BACT|nr:MAG: translation initiation factor IF-3 [Candidatus Curtissbacteria bacterium RBG_13_35_7]
MLRPVNNVIIISHNAIRSIRRSKVIKNHRLNHQITAREVRLIDDHGKQIGVIALEEALKKAQEVELDLVEIAPDAKPPVVKLIDYKKFRYLEDKKRKEAKKHTKQSDLKEIRFSPFIGEHDLETGLKKVKKFLSEGNLVKISIVFKGRQMAHQEFGPKLLTNILSRLEESVAQEREARFEGRRFVTILRSLKDQQNKHETKDQKSSSKEIQNNSDRQDTPPPSDGIPSEKSKKQNG